VDIEKRYRAQFTALDPMLAQMTSTSNFLTQQLANLPKTSNQ
jgi:flagellar hook-associated protein 2